jgi:hypothetical protein
VDDCKPKSLLTPKSVCEREMLRCVQKERRKKNDAGLPQPCAADKRGEQQGCRDGDKSGYLAIRDRIKIRAFGAGSFRIPWFGSSLLARRASHCLRRVLY